MVAKNELPIGLADMIGQLRVELTTAHVAQKVGDTAQVFFSYLAPAAPSEKRGSVPGQVIRSVREKTRQKGDDLAIGLFMMGDRQGALRSAEEATKIYRRLAADNPDAYLPNLAMSLNNLANGLSGMGDRQGAREKAVESIRLLLPFAEQLPARFGALLASSALTYREACEASGGEADEELLAQVGAVFEEVKAGEGRPVKSRPLLRFIRRVRRRLPRGRGGGQGGRSR